MTSKVFIIDTNVLAAGLITANPAAPTAIIVDAMLSGQLFYLLSKELLLEYRNVLLRPKLTSLHGLCEPEIDNFLLEITANAIWREVSADTRHQSPDPQDIHLWALLDSEPNAVLITGDRLLIDQPQPESSVISPATWAEVFGQ
jgi:putative PIN family toxin of toxin-antitoxin system